MRSRRRTASNKAAVRLQNEVKQHLSGAYIRSLVRHLSSSRNSTLVQDNLPPTGTPDETTITVHPQPQPRIQPKKQVRRRFHTSRPYQERLLDMAEARREIVAALKFHRAKMTNSSSHHQLRHILPSPSASSASMATVLPPAQPAVPDYAWSSYYATNNNSVSSDKNFFMGIPKLPLGLNLNMDKFQNLEQTPSPFSSTTSSTTRPTITNTTTSASSEIRLAEPYHPTMDDREMEEIRSMADRHDMEWNDKVNSAHSAWWCCNHQDIAEFGIYGGQGSEGLNGSPAWFQDAAATATATATVTATATTTITTSNSRDYNFPGLDFEGIDGELNGYYN